jgi:hypothetical protein
MSVAPHAPEEIQDILNYLWSWAHRGLELHVNRKALEEAQWALECAGIAQRAAEAHSYFVRPQPAGHLAPSEPMRALEGPRLLATPKRPAEIADLIHNVLYNCVANDGTDFCPTKARRVLERLAYALCRMEVDFHRDRWAARSQAAT